MQKYPLVPDKTSWKAIQKIFVFNRNWQCKELNIIKSLNSLRKILLKKFKNF